MQHFFFGCHTEGKGMNFTKILKGKIHGATVTDANVEYEGSITIDSALMESAGIIKYESVHVWNLSRGTRLETYAIAAPPGSETICVNGAAAHHNGKGDKVIIAAFTFVSGEELKTHEPKLIFVDASNRLARKKD